MSRRWMIYGATGYSGSLLARAAAARGDTPILAARNAQALQALADELGLESRCFPLDSAATVAAALGDIDAVVHCAGPFSATSAPMIEGCLDSHTHYFDITGEIDVYEHAHAQHQRALGAGIIVCPGVGFDIIPTDCVALTLKQALPDASELALGFAGGNAMSPGTAKTTVEALKTGTRLRRGGQLVTTGLGRPTRQIDFGRGPRTAMAIAWGDVATAYYTTGIPNITVYVPASAGTVRTMRMVNMLRPILSREPVQNLLKKRIQKTVHGPDAAARETMRTRVWGEARNAAGDVVTAQLETPNGYDVTISGPLAIVDAVLQNKVSGRGYTTPAQLMGADFVSTLPGCSPITLTDSRNG